MVVVAAARSVDFFGSRWTLGRRGVDGLINEEFRLFAGEGFADSAGAPLPSLA